MFAIAALVWCMTQSDESPSTSATTSVADAGAAPRSTALVEDEFEIPELEPDAGPQPDAGRTTITRVVREQDRSWESCTGEIEAAAARQVIQEHNAQIRNCYERQLKQDPSLEGTMTLSVRVGPDGRVAGTQVSGTLRDREVFACVRAVSSHMRFPAPGGRDCALVQVPFNFSPRR